MIGSRTPFRISFIGGGSDLRDFYSRSPGCVISTSIDKYMYIFVHPFFDDRIQVKYSKTELVNNIMEIRHPIVREVLNKFRLKGLDINSIADIPSGTGLGSSSSYTVGLLNALYKYTGKTVSKEKLAIEACKVEINQLKEPIGKQDQFAASYGGLNLIRFFDNEKVIVEPIKLNENAIRIFQESLLMFYTGVVRSASDILHEQKSNIANDNDRFKYQLEMTALVHEARQNLIDSNFDKFGEILDQNWKLKKKLSKKISNANFDDIYDLAKKNGAIGGKMLGAGGGGFFLFYCPKDKQNQLKSAMRGLKEIPFCFEEKGSKIIDMRA